MKFDPAVRVFGSCALGGCLALIAGCGEAAGPPPPGPNEVRLELGGDHPTIRERLSARPREASGRSGTGPDSGAAIGQGSSPVGSPTEASGRRNEPTGNEPVTPVPEPSSDVVRGRSATLGQGQTLYGLAKEHLGDGARWREIMVLNGLRESQLADLPAGAVLRLPAN